MKLGVCLNQDLQDGWIGLIFKRMLVLSMV